MKPLNSDLESDSNSSLTNESSSSVSSAESKSKPSSEPSKLFVISHFRNEAVIISAGMSFHACKMHEQISSSEAFFCRPVAVNLWIPSAIHCIHLLRTPSSNGLFKETSSSWRIEVNPPGITASSVFSRLSNAFTLIGIHPSFLLGRDDNPVFVVDLGDSFALENDHWL